MHRTRDVSLKDLIGEALRRGPCDMNAKLKKREPSACRNRPGAFPDRH
jgi:hypothetical protein